jgi:hypothetical protein
MRLGSREEIVVRHPTSVYRAPRAAFGQFRRGLVAPPSARFSAGSRLR